LALERGREKRLEQAFQSYKGDKEREIAELATVQAALEQDFSQKDELALTRDNHAAVMRELKRMRDEPGYKPAWTPKTSLADARESASATSVLPSSVPELSMIIRCLNPS
jgi:hypothetical protein